MNPRRIILALVIAFLSIFSGCADTLRSQPNTTWTTSFWYWHDAYGAQPEPAQVTPDVLYFHAGRLGPYGQPQQLWQVWGKLPQFLPAAREYWLVFREETQSLPDVSAAAAIAREAEYLTSQGRARKLPIAGLQLDIDCPTGKLAQYALLLREVRKRLPADEKLSVTALLDWFRDGTAIAAVVKEVDEFVPQFYDIEQTFGSSQRAIAAPIEAEKWSPRFNRFGKRFKIGVSTFGRAEGARVYGDLAPQDVSGTPGLAVHVTHTPSRELVLSYKATRDLEMGGTQYQTGNTIDFTIVRQNRSVPP